MTVARTMTCLSRSRSHYQNDLLRLEFSRFHNSATFSDLTLRYSGLTARVHKIVLCAQSGWFSRACEGGFHEAAEHTIELCGDDADAVGDMLRYCYGVWPETHNTSASADTDVGQGSDASGARLAHIARVYSAADKYDVPHLRTRMEEEFGKGLREAWMVLWASGELGVVAAAAFEGAAQPSTHPLCRIVREGMRRHLAVFREDDEERLRELLEVCPELAVELVIGLLHGGSAIGGWGGDGVWAWAEGGGIEAEAPDMEQDGTRTPTMDEGGIVAAPGVYLRAFCGIRA